MTDRFGSQSLTDRLIGIPLLLAVGAVAVVVVPLFLLGRAFIRTICPNCHGPLAKRIIETTFDRENVKFHLDHYRVSCLCRWCGSHWHYEELIDADMQAD